METFLIDNSIHMIPPGLVSCIINDKEYRVTELSPDGLVIRASEKIEELNRIQVNFFSWYESRYTEIILNDAISDKHIEQEFCDNYRIMTNQQDYREQTYSVSKFYLNYIELKLTGDDGYCSEEMTGYPAKEDDVFCKTLYEQGQEWFDRSWSSGSAEYVLPEYELALGIDNYQKYRSYLEEEFSAFYKKMLTDNYLTEHPLLLQEPTRIYIGNQFCHNLIPDDELLLRLMDKAYQEGLKVTVVFTYMRDNQIESTRNTVERIYQWCLSKDETVEIVINDWGMLESLKDRKDILIPVMGVLLNKRRKDPRYKYKAGYDNYKEELAQNNLGLNEYRDYLSDILGFGRYEYESSGLKAVMPVGHKSLHFPYYQTNTSQFCTLYAGYVNGDRSRQQLVEDCSHYCEHMFYSYPKHLKLIGRYNSLFGMDDMVLSNYKELSSLIANGTDRLVLDTM